MAGAAGAGAREVQPNSTGFSHDVQHSAVRLDKRGDDLAQSAYDGLRKIEQAREDASTHWPSALPLYVLRIGQLACFTIGTRVARYRLRLLLQEFDLPPGETILGRSPECHVTIDDPLVSREHAKIHVEEERVVVKDLGSRNGLKVNGQTVATEQVLHDGDRIRIGNQEVVFSRVVAAKRPGRPTGSLRHCRKCQTPYVAEAPQCPNCGYSPGADETLSGTAPAGNLDRDQWSLQLQVELLDKALSLSRIPDADRVLGRIAVSVEERMTAGMAVDPAQLEGAFAGAVRLSSAQGEIQWLRWVFSTSARLGRPPSRAVVSALAALPPIFVASASKQLEDAVNTLSKKRAQLDEAGHEALDGLIEIRTRVRTQSPSEGV